MSARQHASIRLAVLRVWSHRQQQPCRSHCSTPYSQHTWPMVAFLPNSSRISGLPSAAAAVACACTCSHSAFELQLAVCRPRPVLSGCHGARQRFPPHSAALSCSSYGRLHHAGGCCLTSSLELQGPHLGVKWMQHMPCNQLLSPGIDMSPLTCAAPEASWPGRCRWSCWASTSPACSHSEH